MTYISLYELQMLVDGAINNSLVGSYWVVAEISELKVNASGHCYLELVEKSTSSFQPKAKARAVIWANRFRLIESYFRESTSSTLRNGIKVLVNVKISFHAVYGLSYVIENIDPTYTLGDIERKRQEAIAQLKKDGVFEMNKECELPLIVQRIAVVSSSQAAGYTDFMQELTNNRFGYKFHTLLFHAVVQGETAEQSLLEAFNDIFESSSERDPFDAVVVIRGGGSTSDLSCFDSYNVANVVAQFPLPILAGIGHDKDVSVVDMVAHKSLKTPTAVAQFIVDKAHGFELELEQYHSYVIEQVNEIITQHKSALARYSSNISSLSNIAISETKLKLERLIYRLASGSSEIFAGNNRQLDHSLETLEREAHRKIDSQYNVLFKNISTLGNKATELINKSMFSVELLNSNIEQYDPQRILNMGYSVVKIQGNVVNSTKQIMENSLLSIVCKDGKVTGNLINIK